MHPDLERVLAEDETARAGVDAARSLTALRLDAVRAEIARARDEHLAGLRRGVDESVARILAEGDAEVARRQAARDAHAREDAERSVTLLERAAGLWVDIVRRGPPGKAPR